MPVYWFICFVLLFWNYCCQNYGFFSFPVSSVIQCNLALIHFLIKFILLRRIQEKYRNCCFYQLALIAWNMLMFLLKLCQFKSVGRFIMNGEKWNFLSHFIRNYVGCMWEYCKHCVLYFDFTYSGGEGEEKGLGTCLCLENHGQGFHY